ncbi:MAG TPA: hypothetical protein VFQ39_04430 [Longimicrobium sp.]|nr:hypothetical protein [Longimicrobium sp.]
MPVREPWFEDESNEEREARREAYQRLADAVRRLGHPMERLDQLLRQVATNEAETRRFLAEQVYHVPDDLLDDMVRVRLQDLDSAEPTEE